VFRELANTILMEKTGRLSGGGKLSGARELLVEMHFPFVLEGRFIFPYWARSRLEKMTGTTVPVSLIAYRGLRGCRGWERGGPFL
jgi:hypothetical protein